MKTVTVVRRSRPNEPRTLQAHTWNDLKKRGATGDWIEQDKFKSSMTASEGQLLEKDKEMARLRAELDKARKIASGEIEDIEPKVVSEESDPFESELEAKTKPELAALYEEKFGEAPKPVLKKSELIEAIENGD